MQLMYHSEFDMFKMVSRMVANKFNKFVETAPTCRHVWWICNVPDVLLDGETLYKHVYPINEPSMHI